MVLLAVGLLPEAALVQHKTAQYSQLRGRPNRHFNAWAFAKNVSEVSSITPKQRHDALHVAHRSTIAALTDALFYSRLTCGANQINKLRAPNWCPFLVFIGLPS